MGDPLDQRLFEATGWVLDDGDAVTGRTHDEPTTRVHPPGGKDFHDILRRCEFSAERQRNVVVVRP